MIPSLHPTPFLVAAAFLLTLTSAHSAPAKPATDTAALTQRLASQERRVDISELLAAKGARKTSFAAPAEGLYLTRVLY